MTIELAIGIAIGYIPCMWAEFLHINISHSSLADSDVDNFGTTAARLVPKF